jgi:hypothetical protein
MRFCWGLVLVLAACDRPTGSPNSNTPDGSQSTPDGPPGEVPDGRPDAVPDGFVIVDAGIDSPVDSSVDPVDSSVDGPVDSGPPPTVQIFNVWPPIANPGTTLMLEGTFAGDAVVQFPGGTTATMTALSTHRASVVVPPASTVGSLRLDGGPNSHVIFHAHDYQLGFQKIEPYEQTDTARQPGLLAEAVHGHGSVTIGKYVYVIGGYNGTFSTRVQRATLNADGTLGNFAIVPGVSLVHGRDFFATAIVGNFIYVIGGLVEGSSALARTIETAPIHSDGTIGTFTESSVALVVPRTDVTAAVVGNYLYVIGGTFLSSVERATINLDGTIGSFDLLSNVTLAVGVAGASTQVIGNQLYVIGGAPSDQGYPSRGVQAARIRKDGRIDTFATVPGVTMFSGRASMATAVIGNWLYVFGGGFDSSASDTLIERAPIRGDHTLGAFESTNRYLPHARYGVTVVFAGNTLHVVGGAQGAGWIGESSVLRATIDVSGGLVNFALDQATIATARYGHGLVTSGDGVYLLGGNTGANTYTASVGRATVVEGEVGNFTNQAGVTLSTARAGFTSAVIGKYVYVIGGRSASGVIGTIERAVIAPDGKLGTFAPYTGSLATARADHSAAVINGYGPTRFLVVFGGIAGNGTILGSVEIAPIEADGTLGAFATVAGGKLTTPRYQAAVIVHVEDSGIGASIYVVGGRGANGYLADVERGHIEPDGKYYGSFPLAGLSLGTPRAGHALSLIGSQLYVIGGSNAGGALDGVEVATFGPDAAVPLTQFTPASGVHLHDPRGFATCTVIANELYAIGGLSSLGALATVEHARLH